MNWFEEFLGETRARIVTMLRRSSASIAELASRLHITGNAVRGHVASLQAGGLVRVAGTAPSGGGKPAHLYDITLRAEELFPKAYVLMLGEMVRSLKARDGQERTRELLRQVGAAAVPEGATGGRALEARVQAAARVLQSIGGDVEVNRLPDGWEIRGHGCPLSAVVLVEPDACAVAQGLVGEVTGTPVVERCDRSDRARCVFFVAATPEPTAAS